MKIETRNIDELTIHPAIKSQPRLSEDELLEWRKGFKQRGEGNIQALSITADNQIVDGRHRFWCAKKLGWKTVPVEVVGDNEVNAIIVQSLTNRRSYTKGQLAYILAPFVDENANRAIRFSNLKTGAATPEANSVRFGASFTTDELAALIKTSSRIIQQAIEVRELFKADKVKRTMTDRDEVTEKDVTLEEFFEPRILLAEDPEAPRTRAYGLGAVLAGCHALTKMEDMTAAGRVHGGGRPERIEKQLNLFDDSLKSFSTKFTYWAKWEPETRQAAMQALPPVVEKMPDDLLAEFAKLVKTELKRREK
jgi:hypothetical protein